MVAPNRHGVQPGRAFPLEQQAVGVVEMAGLGEGVRDVGRARESGLLAIVTLVHQLGEPLSCGRLGHFIEQSEDDRERIHGGAVRCHLTATGDLVVVERLACALYQSGEVGGVGGQPESWRVRTSLVSPSARSETSRRASRIACVARSGSSASV